MLFIKAALFHNNTEISRQMNHEVRDENGAMKKKAALFLQTTITC